MIGTAPISPSQPLGVPGRKTASGGLSLVAPRRVGRTASQAADALGKNRLRYDGARRGAVLPQRFVPSQDCWKGLDPKKTGQVTFTAGTGAGAFLLGAAFTRGTFRTESGITGKFTSAEFLVGVRGEIGIINGYSKNLSTFIGGNDTYSGGIILFDDIGLATDIKGNIVGGSTTVAGKGLDFGISVGFSNTEITLTGCRR